MQFSGFSYGRNPLNAAAVARVCVRAWCRENEISEKTYYYWQRRLYQQMASTAERVDFAEIPWGIQTDQSPGAAAKVCLSGATIEVYPGADAQMIQVILETLKSC